MFYFIKSFLIAVQHEEEIELAPSSDRERNESCEQVSMLSNFFFLRRRRRRANVLKLFTAVIYEWA